MKKILSITCSVLLSIMTLTGCSNNPGENKEQLKIVTTIFPEYDWAKEIMGEKAEDAQITLLLDNGVDLHSFQPTTNDMMAISECDVFIYVGGESDEWVEDALNQATNKDMKVINLLEVLGDQVKEEEVVEGMEEEEEESEEEIEYDEHVWLSLKNTQIFVQYMADTFSEVDPDNKDVYQMNAKAYNEKLSSFDQSYEDVVNNASKKTLLFGDRFPFRYLVDDYGLDYYAAFVGCSAETEASFETIIFLSNKVDELNLSSVVTIESSDGKIAKTIIENTKDKNQSIFVLDSMQSTTTKDAENGVTYLSIVEDNLNILKEILK